MTEDISLKLRVCVSSKSNPYYQGREFKTHFCSELCPFFQLRFFILYQAPHRQALAPAFGALVLFMHCLTHSHTMTPFDAPGKQGF